MKSSPASAPFPDWGQSVSPPPPVSWSRARLASRGDLVSFVGHRRCRSSRSGASRSSPGASRRRAAPGRKRGREPPHPVGAGRGCRDMARIPGGGAFRRGGAAGPDARRRPAGATPARPAPGPWGRRHGRAGHPANQRPVYFRASCEKRVRPSFCLRPRGERGSADGTQRSQDDSDRHCGRGAGAAGVHGACLPVMRASTREEMRRISSTSRSSSRLFSIHSR